MLDKIRLKDVLTRYKQDFILKEWENEKFKWEAVQWFQHHWDIDAVNFAEMLAQALEKTANLLVSRNYFPSGMVKQFAVAAPEDVRAMFRALYDESRDVYQRMEQFKAQSKMLLEQYGNGAVSHYQDEHAMSVYLWLRYPNQYYIYKYSEVKLAAKLLKTDYHFKEGAYEENIKQTTRFYDELRSEIAQDDELIHLFHSQLAPRYYSDPMLHTLVHDIVFYMSRYYPKQTIANNLAETYDSVNHAQTDAYLNENEESPRFWWLNANPKYWKFSKIDVGGVIDYTLRSQTGAKRRIYQNFLDARPGDIVIGYESQPIKKIVALAKVKRAHDGETLSFEKTEDLSCPITYQTLKACAELANMEFFTNKNGTLFKLTKTEFEFIMDMIREDNPITVCNIKTRYLEADFLKEVYMSEAHYRQLVGVLKHKKNIILQGAPGVGKTYTAKRLAYAMMGEIDDSRIEFIQFHQNYVYEDFIMGYKPAEDGFELKDGVFYRFCQKAASQPEKAFFFIIDEINRGNLSKIFGELLMLIEKDYRGQEITLAYNGLPFSVPDNLYIIGMMNTADRSLAMIDYALRRRFSFVEMEPGFDSSGFQQYQENLNNVTFNALIEQVKLLNAEIAADSSLGKGFCIGHSYFCGQDECIQDSLRSIVDYEILPMLGEYWFDDLAVLERWRDIFNGVLR